MERFRVQTNKTIRETTIITAQEVCKFLGKTEFSYQVLTTTTITTQPNNDNDIV